MEIELKLLIEPTQADALREQLVDLGLDTEILPPLMSASSSPTIW